MEKYEQQVSFLDMYYYTEQIWFCKSWQMCG